ncbi:MAG: hypothetical protein HYS12_01025 [Planctomycetes bacterium]|nr:hypothetical protein [Planctomycetota bacterium]
MSIPNDDLPLDNRAGNAYDPLFAARIDALAKSSGGRPAPSQPGGNTSGAGWPVGVAVFLGLVLLRGCASLSTSGSRSSSYDYGHPNSTELLEKSRRIQEMPRERREQEGGIQKDFDDDPAIGARAPNAEEVFRKVRERLDGLRKQQAEPPEGPNEPDRQP